MSAVPLHWPRCSTAVSLDALLIADHIAHYSSSHTVMCHVSKVTLSDVANDSLTRPMRIRGGVIGPDHHSTTLALSFTTKSRLCNHYSNAVSQTICLSLLALYPMLSLSMNDQLSVDR